MKIKFNIGYIKLNKKICDYKKHQFPMNTLECKFCLLPMSIFNLLPCPKEEYEEVVPQFVNGLSEKLHFNKTLQRNFSNYREADKFAKTKGLECIGNESLGKVFDDKKAKQADSIAAEQKDRLKFDLRKRF